MHKTALDHCQLFFDTYAQPAGRTIVDIGAQDVNGSLRSVAPVDSKYVGVDFAPGKGVDVIISDPYALPFADSSIDAVVSSSCFEHSEFFWLTFLEAVRVLKPDGLLYLNVPSNGYFHRYPVDCWRFYPDSGIALQNWAGRNGYSVALMESYVGQQRTGPWNDFVAVFVKEAAKADLYPARMQHRITDFTNGFVRGSDQVSNFSIETQDQLSLCGRLRRAVRDRLLGGLK